MSRIVELLAEIVEATREHLPDLKTCTTHGGKLTVKELHKIATRAPAVHFAVLDAPCNRIHSQEAEAYLTLVAYVTTRDRPRLPAEISGANLAEELLKWIPRRSWVAFAYPAEKVNGRNLYSAASDSRGISLWGVSWKQKIRLELLTEDQPLLKTLYITSSRDEIIIGDEDD